MIVLTWSWYTFSRFDGPGAHLVVMMVLTWSCQDRPGAYLAVVMAELTDQVTFHNWCRIVHWGHVSGTLMLSGSQGVKVSWSQGVGVSGCQGFRESVLLPPQYM